MVGGIRRGKVVTDATLMVEPLRNSFAG
jgi:hypothetical protein